jgi:hypothetical protein
MRTRKFLASLFATGLFAVGAAAPAAAQPVITGGLINITIVDVLNNNQVTVQVPVGVAANVCDTNVAALFAEIEDTGSADCDADADAIAFALQRQR